METSWSNRYENKRRWSPCVAVLLVTLWSMSSGVLSVRADRATLDPTRTQVARQLPAPPTIDGVVDAAEWERAASNNDYWQVIPDTRSWVPDGIRGGVMGLGPVPDDANDLSFKKILAGYDDKYLYIAVKVNDSVISTDSAEAGSVNGNTWNDDSVEVFVDAFNGNAAKWSAATDNDKVGGQYVITANNAYRENEAGNPGYGPDAAWYAKTALTATGYEAEFRIALTNIGNPKPGDIIGFTVSVNDDDGDPGGGIGPRKRQVNWVGAAHEPVTYGNLMIGPRSYTAQKVTKSPIPDGKINPNEYSGAAEIHVNAQIGVVYVPGGDDDLAVADLDYKAYVVHDNDAVYIAVDVTDDVLSSDSVAAQIAAGKTHADGFSTWYDDSVEIFFDLDNSKRLGGADSSVLASGVFEGQYTLTPFNTQYNGSPSDQAVNGVQWFGKASITPTGYQIEFKIPKTTLGITKDNVSIGFHIAVNDDDKVGDYSHVGWTGQAHNENTYGTLTLAGGTTTTAFRVAETKPDAATGDLKLTWEGGNPPFLVEKATSVKGPFLPVGPAQSGRVFTDPGVLKNAAQSYYRIRY